MTDLCFRLDFKLLFNGLLKVFHKYLGIGHEVNESASNV
jgi:hypothetical protein